MNDALDPLADFRRACGQSWSLPERRRIVMHRARRQHEPTRSPAASPVVTLTGLAWAWQLLDEHFILAGGDLAEERNSWQRYLALPQASRLDKLVGQVFRLLRVVHIARLHPQGYIKRQSRTVRIGCCSNRYPVALDISEEGLALIEAFVFVFLDARCEPWSAAYLELLLGQYFLDIVSEIAAFEDEDNQLFQFHQARPFNRQLRLLCTNPVYEQEDGFYRFDVPAAYRDPARHPIDFCFVAGNTLHLVPVEALNEFCLPRSELARWQLHQPEQTRSSPIALAAL